MDRIEDILRLISSATKGRVTPHHNLVRGTFTLVTHSRARAYAVVYADSTHPLKILRDIAVGDVRWLPWDGEKIIYRATTRRGRSVVIPVEFPEGT